ncbi:MAG TPA: metalloregulator ArsR/SmtB family transcription factor [Dehalococcoidia bacterium]|nr:metalloregulator ArsR/SmtB family transcription factor [Dehalococcoidia bacterium]
MDKVFKALADPGRRRLLDLLFEKDGQTLGELSGEMDMTRQAVSQHLSVLEDANLVSSIRRGRARLHYLNPVPIQDISDRWIHKYARRHMQALRRLKARTESMHG